jgi:hypothetical protein
MCPAPEGREGNNSVEEQESINVSNRIQQSKYSTNLPDQTEQAFPFTGLPDDKENSAFEMF